MEIDAEIGSIAAAVVAVLDDAEGTATAKTATATPPTSQTDIDEGANILEPDPEPGSIAAAVVAVLDDATFDERAAIIEFDAKAPLEWAEAFAHLNYTMPPAGVPPARWRQIIDDGGRLLDRWAYEAAALGWLAADVFGVDPGAPMHRYDNMGLVPLICGGHVVAITPDAARIECHPGRYQTYYRCSRASPVTLWELR
jgi:hypothetical protein